MSASSSPDILVNTLTLITAATNTVIFGYVGLRAFRIRQALLVPLYRNQALWTGSIASYWILTTFVPLLIVLLNSRSTISSYPLFIGLFVGVVVFFAWYDTLVKIARDSDPLEREILGWRYLRLVLWTAVAIAIVWAFLVVAPAVLNESGLPPIPQLLLFYADNSPIFFLLGAVGAIAVLTGSRRSGDFALKRQLKWAGVYIFVLFLYIVTVVLIVAFSGGTVPLSGAALAPEFVLIESINFALAFSLYKVSKSLVPTSRFEYPNPPPRPNRLGPEVGSRNATRRNALVPNLISTN